MPTEDKPIDVLSAETLMLLYGALNRCALQMSHPACRNCAEHSRAEAIKSVAAAKKKLDEINDRNEKRV